MKPMYKYPIDDHITIRISDSSDAVELFKQIDETRDQLEQFMSWAKTTKKVEDETKFLEYCQRRYQSGKLLPTTILVDGEIAGMFDFHNIDEENRRCEIGYWLGTKFQHNGVMIKFVKKATQVAFEELDMHSVQILAMVDNIASNNVAKNAGLRLEGTFSDYLFLNGIYHDTNVYSQISVKND
jgi:ribosomal-protein-serine acetyltransferase